jgi:hypothetical protein
MNNSYVVIDDFLEDSDLELLNNYIDNIQSNQSVLNNPDLSKRIYKYKFNSIGVLELSEYITISKNNKPIAKHKDNRLSRSITHKILIYLNSVPNGGTYFYIDGKEVLVENKRNRLILFNIDIEHSSQQFSSEHLKKTIGFRPIMSL